MSCFVYCRYEIQYLLVVGGETGKGFNAWFPHLLGVFAAGESKRQVLVLAKQAADEELSELSTLSAVKLGSSRQIDLSLKGIATEEKLSTVFTELQIPDTLVVLKKRCRDERTKHPESYKLGFIWHFVLWPSPRNSLSSSCRQKGSPAKRKGSHDIKLVHSDGRYLRLACQHGCVLRHWDTACNPQTSQT